MKHFFSIKQRFHGYFQLKVVTRKNHPRDIEMFEIVVGFFMLGSS